jgi:phospholipase C
MISIHATRRFACVLVGLVSALLALSAASPAALADRLPPPGGSGGSTQAQTPIHTIVTNGGRGAPRPVPTRRVSPIRHVVVIYLENHSFDNVLGYWCKDNPGRCPDGGMPSSVTLSDGAVVTPGTTPPIVPGIAHTVKTQQAALDVRHGVPQMNGWQDVGGCGPPRYWCISGYQPSSLPNLTRLASRYAISDRTFSLADSPSWGGHLYAAMGSLDGFTGDNPWAYRGGPTGPGWGCDSDRVENWISPSGGKRVVPSCVPDYRLGLANGGAFMPTPVSYHATIFDELDAAGLSWHIYGATRAEPCCTKDKSGIDGGYGWSICPSLAECIDNPAQRQNLVDATQFTTDARAGNLPAYSIVTAGGSGNLIHDSCHNGGSMTACDNYIGQLVSAVQSGPDWPSTAIFITFDDCGCFYDQAPPPLAPDDTQEGPRVPLIIVSPYARPGYTDTTATTFAGLLAYVEHTFGLPPLGPNDKRAYPFTNAFNYSQAPLKPVRMTTRPLPASARRIHLTNAELNDPT